MEPQGARLGWTRSPLEAGLVALCSINPPGALLKKG
jgi:hypothetical protein